MRRMIRDLICRSAVVGETVREPDGLADVLAQRYLSAEERRRAADLSRTLLAARGRAVHGATDSRQLEDDARRQLEASGFQVDYVEAVDAETMRLANRVLPASRSPPRCGSGRHG